MMKKKLNEIRKDLKEAIKFELEKLGPKVIYGELTRSGNLDLPINWYFPIPHTPEMTGVHTEQHAFKFGFAALVKDLDIQEGTEKAEVNMSNVYDQITKADDNSIRNICHDIVPGQYNPAYRRADSNRIFWASCEISFIVRRYKTTDC